MENVVGIPGFGIAIPGCVTTCQQTFSTPIH